MPTAPACRARFIGERLARRDFGVVHERGIGAPGVSARHPRPSSMAGGVAYASMASQIALMPWAKLWSGSRIENSPPLPSRTMSSLSGSTAQTGVR